MVKREGPEGRWVPEIVLVVLGGDLGRKQKSQDELGSQEGSKRNKAVSEKLGAGLGVNLWPIHHGGAEVETGQKWVAWWCRLSSSQGPWVSWRPVCSLGCHTSAFR